MEGGLFWQAFGTPLKGQKASFTCAVLKARDGRRREKKGGIFTSSWSWQFGRTPPGRTRKKGPRWARCAGRRICSLALIVWNVHFRNKSSPLFWYADNGRSHGRQERRKFIFLSLSLVPSPYLDRHYFNEVEHSHTLLLTCAAVILIPRLSFCLFFFSFVCFSSPLFVFRYTSNFTEA